MTPYLPTSPEIIFDAEKSLQKGTSLRFYSNEAFFSKDVHNNDNSVCFDVKANAIGCNPETYIHPSLTGPESGCEVFFDFSEIQ